MLQFHLRTLLIGVLVCCLLAAGARYLPPTDLRSATQYGAAILFYSVLAVVWCFAYVRAPRAAVTLAAAGLCGVFVLSLALCLVVQSRERARSVWYSHMMREVGFHYLTYDDLHRPRSPEDWRDFQDYHEVEQSSAKR